MYQEYQENFNHVKLEKGMYHLANKSFLQALEEADASSAYENTPLAGLDAYERQLKRFDIRVSGVNCDKVEKFFTTTESAVLFPEFIRRAVMQGMEESVLPEITAAVTWSESNRYQGCVLSDTTAYSVTTSATAMPVSSILESTTISSIDKYGRTVQASYEAVRQQRLDIFALMLRRIGKQLADSIIAKAILVMKNGANATKTTIAAKDFAYSDLASLYGKFKSFHMKALLASPGMMAKILVMDEMLEASSKDVTEICLPFGTKLINCSPMDDNLLIGMDTDFALEQIQSSEVILETDKLIDRQLDCIGISVNVGFRVLMTDALRTIELTTSTT
ncbi:MAG: hypothetical protein K2J71_08620 [Oscillospiraceae bacterium]|nr:hypothetical protein [Oscillospiraceae bacterium]